MKYFQVVAETTDQVAKKILKDYNGRAYIIKLVKETREEREPLRWYHRIGFKPVSKTKFYYRAYCSLPEDSDDLEAIHDLKEAPPLPPQHSVTRENLKTFPPAQEKESSQGEIWKGQIQDDMANLRKIVSGLYEASLKSKQEELFLPPLLGKGFSYDFSQNFLSSLQTDIRDEKILRLVLREKIRMQIPLQEDFFFEPGYNYLFLGPTGVGKTTTLAKMAALCYKQGIKDFRFVSFDSYRLGADEQLKRFADIFEKPFELIQNMKEMNRLEKLRGEKEIFFLDTAGESIKREVKLSEVAQYIEVLKGPTKIFLVLSVHSKLDDLIAIRDQFRVFPIQAYIITKLDETSQIGNILEFLCMQKEPVIFYTNGQAVPDDINPMSLEKFFEYI